MSAVREARLDPRHSLLYPMVPAGVWLPASDVGARMLEWALMQADPPVLANRLLNDDHFEFRGGTPRGPTAAGTMSYSRREDPERAAQA